MNQNKTLYDAQLSSSTYWMFSQYVVFCSPSASLVSFHEYFFFLHQLSSSSSLWTPTRQPRCFHVISLSCSPWLLSLGRQLQAQPSQSSTVQKKQPAVFRLVVIEQTVTVSRNNTKVSCDRRSRYATMWIQEGFKVFWLSSWVLLLLPSCQNCRQDVGWRVNGMM